MAFDRIIQILLPKDDKFFMYFEESAQTIAKAAETLRQISAGDRLAIAEQMHDFEHQCDAITHKIFSELNATFVTPFDREDIHSLATALDDIMDYMDEASGRFILYKIGNIPVPMIKMTEILHDAAKEIAQGVSMLRDLRKSAQLRKTLEQIHTYENQADRIFEQTIADLFENEKDPIQLIKLKDICGSLEKATDKCEDVANVLETILIKHA